MMKKITLTLVGIVFAVALFGCNKGEDTSFQNEAPPAGEGAVPEVKTDKKLIGAENAAGGGGAPEAGRDQAIN